MRSDTKHPRVPATSEIVSVTSKMSKSPPIYGNVLNAVAKQKGCTLEYTVPALVSGGICPPPSRVYPGTVCYMITVKLDRTEYHGFGPTPIIARHYAEVEAYNALVKAPSIEEAKVTSPDILQVFASEGNATTTRRAIVEDRTVRNQQASTTGSSGNDERHISGSGSQHLVALGRLEENLTYNESGGDPCPGGVNDGSSKALQDNSTTYSHKASGTIPAPVCGNAGDAFCEIPLPKSSYHIPEDHDETVKMLVKSSESKVDGNNPSAFTFRKRNQRDITDVLYEVARQKGVKVIIEVGSCGPPRLRQVLVKVRGGGMQFEGRHAKRNVARAIAAQKFIDALKKFPEASWETEPTLSPDTDQHENTATSSNTHPQSSSLQSPQSPAGLKLARDTAKCSLGMPSPILNAPPPMSIRDMPSIIPPHAATDCTLSHVTSTSRDLSTAISTVNSSLSTNGNNSRVPRQYYERMPPVYSNAPFSPTAVQVNPPLFSPTAVQVNPPPFGPTAVQVNPPPFSLTAVQTNPPPFGPTAVQVNPPPFSLTAVQTNPPPFSPTAVQANPPPFSPTAVQANPPPFSPTAVQANPPPFSPTAVQANPPPFSLTAVQANPPPFSPTAVQANPPPFSPTAVQVNPQHMLLHGGDRQGQQYPQHLMYHIQSPYVRQYASFSNIQQIPQATNMSYSVRDDNVRNCNPNPHNTPNVSPLKEKHTPQWDYSPNPHNIPNVPPLNGSIQEVQSVHRESVRASQEATATEGTGGEKQKRRTAPYRDHKYTYSQTDDSVDQLSSSKHDSDVQYPANPVGQLQELLLKELNILPVFAERIQSAGKFKRYTCVVSAKGLSAEGIASSKKLARRHAAENLLVVMEEEGMNINPNLVEMRTKDTHLKKSKRSKIARENLSKTNSSTKASSTSPSPQLQKEIPTVYAQPSMGTQRQPQPQTSPPMESQACQVGPQPRMDQPRPVLPHSQFASQGPQGQRVGPYAQFEPPGTQDQRVGPHQQFVPPGPQDQRVGPYPQFGPPGTPVGSCPQFEPPEPQVRSDQQVGPRPQFVPPGSHVGPDRRIWLHPQFIPPGLQVGPDQQVGPHPQFVPPGPQVGPHQRVGPHPQFVPPGPQVGPDQRVGPHPQFVPAGPQVCPDQRVGPHPQFVPPGPRVCPDQRVWLHPQFEPPRARVGQHPQIFPQLLQQPYFSPYYRPPHPQPKSGLLPTPSAVIPRQVPGEPPPFLPTPYPARQGLTIPTPYTSMTYHGPPMPYGPPIVHSYSSPRPPGPAPPTLGSIQPPIYPHPLKMPSVTTTESESETEDGISLGLCEIVPDQVLKTPTSDVSQRDSDSSKAMPGRKLQPTSTSAVSQRDGDSSKAMPGRKLQSTSGLCSTTGHNPSPDEIPGREKASYETIEPPSSKQLGFGYPERRCEAVPSGGTVNESFSVLESSPNNLASLAATRDQLQTDTSGELSETTRKTRETTRQIPPPPSTSKGKWVPLSRPCNWPDTSHKSPSTDPLYFTERLPREREDEWTGGKVKTTRHKIVPSWVKSEETPRSQSDAILSVQKMAYTVSDHSLGNEDELPVHPLMKMTHDSPSGAGRPSHLSTPLSGVMTHDNLSSSTGRPSHLSTPMSGVMTHDGPSSSTGRPSHLSTPLSGMMTHDNLSSSTGRPSHLSTPMSAVMTHDGPSSSAGRPSHLSTPLSGVMRQLAGYLIGSGENVCVGLPTEGSVEDTISSFQ